MLVWSLFKSSTPLNQEITNLLKCSICWEYYNLPTVLPCGHTFCLKCIQEIGKHKVNNVNTTKPGVELSIDCPNCRLKVPIVDIQRMKNGVHVNYVLSSIVEAVLQLRSSQKVDAATNTDSEANFNYRMNDIQKGLDEVFKVVCKRKSVVNDARKQIDEIRSKAIKRTAVNNSNGRQGIPTATGNVYNRNTEIKSSNTTISNNSNEQTTWASRLFPPQTVNRGPRSNLVNDLTDVDPAILSVRTTRTDAMMNGAYFPMAML